MKIKNKFLIALLAGLLTFFVSFLGLLNGLDYMATDLIYQRPGMVDNNIKILAIDEKSLNELGPYGTWDRAVYADLLNKLYEDPENKPALVVFDVIFQGETNDSSDSALALAAKNAGGVVSAVNMVFQERVETDGNGKKVLNPFYVEMMEYPYDALKENTYLGFADSIQDARDGAVRSFFPILKKEGEAVIPSLALSAARVLSERGKGEINIPDTAPGESLIIKYQGKPGDYETISIIDVLNGKIPKEALRDTVLFVGAYAPGMMDAFSVPTDHGSQMYGVEIHANILDSIFKGEYLIRSDRVVTSVVYGLLAFIFALLAEIIPLVATAGLGVIIIVLQIAFCVFQGQNHLFVPVITLPVAVIIIILSALLIRYFNSLAQKRKVLKAFRQYVAPEVVKAVSEKGDFELKLGGEKRDIAVLFVDIRGFTPLSEALEPEQVVEVLNEYLSLTTKSIFDNFGTLDKFVGDATMAVFNAPFDLEDYTYKAVCAARDIVAGGEALRKKAFELTGKEVNFGIGVNCGPAVVGNIGCDFRMDYTAIGDTVNTSARLEANAKPGQVLLSPAVVSALEGRIEVEPVGELSLKGKAKPMEVFALKRVI